jgi:hypothetical protein
MVRNVRSRIGLVVALLLALTAFGGFSLGTASAKPGQQATRPAPDSPGYYVYSVKFVCGAQKDTDPELTTVRPGVYATEINTHNYATKEIDIEKHIIPLVADEQAIGREPEYSKVAAKDKIVLPPDSATLDDCYRIWKLLSATPGTLYIGFLEIISPIELSIDAVYTVQGDCQGYCNTDIDVQRVEGKFVTP